nr:response regulator [Planctomycetota bacterium]
ERKNQEVEQARSALEEKAKQLALTSKYKSEFLANMSHELRTPLNSLLILSDQLSRNHEGNLTGKQVEYSRTIHASGNDLLSLINDILDLSKIESGTVTVEASELGFAEMQDYVERTFRHVAESRGLQFAFTLTDGLPKSMVTDAKRLQQVIKNLLSNAFKFTEEGLVEVKVGVVQSGWDHDNENLNKAKGGVLAFSVSDTGIGIPSDKQQIIFEAFQQADGSTSRKYGGTGLGLAISREISRMLGGEIRLESTPGKGSTFTLFLPRLYTPPKGLRRSQTPEIAAAAAAASALPNAEENVSTHIEDQVPEVSQLPNELSDDRANLKKGDRVLLIVDNDVAFSKFLLEMAHDKGFKALVTSKGGAAVALAREFNPTAVMLDIKLPDIDGWRVLDNLKSDLNTRHIPVHIISNDDNAERAFRQGALGLLSKPVSKEQLDTIFGEIRDFAERGTRNLLIVEDDEVQRNSIVELIGDGNVHTVAVGSGKEALAILKDERFDCMVVDLGLPDINGIQLIEKARKASSNKALPIIVYTGRDLTKKEDTQLRRVARSIIVKDFRAPERLLDEASMCLHRPKGKLPAAKQRMIEKLHEPEVVLKGRKVLVVDDDIRNIFAMTSLLERYNMEVLSAENGKDAIAVLESTPDVDVALMDIMMPEMDGYDTMRAIRLNPKFRSLPIIALTAKAMKGDREKCIDAGASDYVAKPVDSEKLLSLLCVWLYQAADRQVRGRG